MDCLPSPWFSLERERERQSGPPPAACLFVGLDLDPHPLLCVVFAPPSCTLSQWQVLSTQPQQAAAALCGAGANRGLLPDLGKWTTLLALRFVPPKWPGRPHQISRRSAFWCNEICCAGFIFKKDQYRRDLVTEGRQKCFILEISPFQSCGACVTCKTRFFWCCGSPH